MPPIDFKSLLSSFVSGDLSIPETSIWLVYTAAIIETVSSANHITELWKHISSEVKDEEKQLIIARRLREGLLKTSPLAGLPKGINCLSALRSATKEKSESLSKTLESDKSLRADHSALELGKRGQAFFSRVYGKVTSRVQQNMALSSGGDLDQFVILSIYGELMAEERIINAKETGLLEFLACYVSSAAPQAKGHLYGSRNLGNGKEEIFKGIRLAKAVARELGVIIDTESMGVAEKIEGW